MDRSPIGKLPPELRIEIFEYVLYSPAETDIFEWDDKGPMLPRWMTANNRQALTSVCRSIRAESFPIFYRFSKISFCPKILEKFQPGFFVTEDQNKQQMIWEYLGPSNMWAERLCDWLGHMGDNITRGIEAFDIDIGTWANNWTSLENPLMVWLTEALAKVIRHCHNQGTQVYIRTFLQTHGWWTDHIPLELPMSSMSAACEALHETVRQKKERLNLKYRVYPSLAEAERAAHDACRDVVSAFLEQLHTQIEQQLDD